VNISEEGKHYLGHEIYVSAVKALRLLVKCCFLQF